MNTKTLFALILGFVLALTPVAAYHYDSYQPYGSYSQDYTRSYTTESVTSQESEYHRSSSGCGYRYCHSTGNYDYGRSRSFSFSRTNDYEHSSTNYGYRGAPYSNYGRSYSSYNYPYYNVNSGDYEDYRPFSDSYHLSHTSPYYNPYRYSSVGAYSGYRPYGY